MNIHVLKENHHCIFFPSLQMFKTHKNISVLYIEPTLVSTEIYKSKHTYYYSIIIEKEKMIMFFRKKVISKKFKHKHANASHDEVTYCIESKDGKNFTNTRILFQNHGCLSHNFLAWYDKKTDKYYGIGGQHQSKLIAHNKHPLSCKKKFKYMLCHKHKLIHSNKIISCRNNGLYLLEYKNNKFHDVFSKPCLDGSHPFLKYEGYYGFSVFDTISNVFYDSYTKKYWLYQRANVNKNQRFVKYTTTQDFIKWEPFYLVNVTKKNSANFNIYSTNIQMLYNHYIGLNLCFMIKTIHGIKYFSNFGLYLMYSENGRNWNTLSCLFPIREKIAVKDPHQYLYYYPVVSPILEQDNHYLIYIQNKKYFRIELYKIPKDRFFGIYGKNGTFTTKEIKIKGSLTINCKIKGSIQCELKYKNQVYKDYSFENFVPLSTGDYYSHELRWETKEEIDLEKTYTLSVQLKDSSIYAIYNCFYIS